jgi:hypothetical protein
MIGNGSSRMRSGVLWSNNPLGNMLGNMLKGLLEQGVLEENEDQQFRYNVNFKPPWER